MHAPPSPPIPLVRCQGCPHGFAKLVGSRGTRESPLVVVGESPGKEEIKVGLPFVGPSGQVLDHALAQHPDLSPLFLNAIQCFPGSVSSKSQEKVSEATRCCQARLYKEITEHPRKVILALGNPAVWSTTNSFGTKITRVRGTLYKSPLASKGIVASVHPAFLLRGGGSMRQFLADVDYACRLTKEPDGLKRYVVPKVHVAKTLDNIIWLTDQIAKQEYVAADTETGGYQGFDFLRDRILCVGFCWDPNHTYVVPEPLIHLSRRIFRNTPNTRYIWHNGKFDQKFFWAKGIPECRVDEDTMLLSYALDETKGIHDLEQVSGDLLGAPDWKFMIKPHLGKGKTFADVPRDILYDYMSRDISSTLQIFYPLRNQVKRDPGLETLYTRTLIPMSKYMARIEFKGMMPDLNRVSENEVQKTAEATELEVKFNTIAQESGFGFLNIRSPQQVGAFLYDHLALRDPRRKHRRPLSTDEATLLTLPQSPVVQHLLKYREVHKGLSTYVTSVGNHVGKDNRIHTSYLIHGTTTGRPASREPNLLNIPRDPLLRGQFVASPGYFYMEVDVNQAELRVLAELSRDPELTHIYTTPNAPSIHLVTQIEMFGDPKQYTPQQIEHFMDKFSTHGDLKRTLDEQNMRAKTVNFGIVYGRGADSIAEEFKIPRQEATEWIAKWFAKYAGAHEFIQRCRKAPLLGQNLVTPFGRKRRFQIVNRERLNDIQNQAANFPEQSIACDCVTHTGIEVQEMAYYEYNAQIVNTVYDSLLFEMPADTPKALELGAKVLRVLSDVPKRWGLTRIPFRGDIKIGTRWGSLEKVPLPDVLKAEHGLT